jgi:beta-lactamase class A
VKHPTRSASVPLVVLTLVLGVLTLGIAHVDANRRPTAGSQEAGTLSVVGAIKVNQSAPAVTPLVAPTLAAAVHDIEAGSGASVAVTLVELDGSHPRMWSQNGDGVFDAASTYKLAALMMEAQRIAGGKTDPNGPVCYTPEDYEPGWFDDYSPGTCFTRNELAARAGKQSDNTAGHMLVRDVGGSTALNAWAFSLGAKNSAFFVGNTTTSDDLSALWQAEASGRLGGKVAQAWLYPLLTNTRFEDGIPAGVPSGVTVIHKVGADDWVEDDSGLIVAAPQRSYILTVMSKGNGGAAGWQLAAQLSAAAWAFEASRTHR